MTTTKSQREQERRWARGQIPRQPLEVRFWAKVAKPLTGDGCWLWMGHRNQGGYGQVSVNRHMRQAHRVAYELSVGPIPEGLTLDHLCRVRHCVNPSHLEPVTELENIRRGTVGENMRSKTHCPQGHPYDEANTRHTKNGNRLCRACYREHQRRYLERAKSR